MGRRVIATAAAAAALAAATIAAAPASSAAQIDITKKVDVTTHIAKANLDTTFPTGTLNGVLDTDASTITGTLSLPTATTWMKLGSLNLVRVQTKVVPEGPSVTKVKVDGTRWDLTTTQKSRIKIVGIYGPTGLINYVGSRCMTSTATTQVLTGSFDWAKTGVGGPNDYTMKGTYTIPQFANCGIATPLVNALIPGTGNTMSAHFRG